jgi:hypothetical protein
MSAGDKASKDALVHLLFNPEVTRLSLSDKRIAT